MGRRLNIAQPTVIDTMLSPLNESFNIEQSGPIRQWFYNIDGSYKPDREVTPLILTPHISVYDPETKATYYPTITHLTSWSMMVETQSGDYEWEVIDASESSASDDSILYYVRPDFSLVVRTNTPSTSPIVLKCTLVYEDPRLAGQTHTIEETMTLSTSEDTSLSIPELRIENPSVRTFDVLAESERNTTTGMMTCTDTFTCKAYLGGVDVTDSTYLIWYIKTGGIEVLAQNHPCYVSGQNTSVLTVDLMYAETITAICRAKQSSTAAELYPSEAVADYVWQDNLFLHATAASQNGTKVDSIARDLTFDTICNIRGHMMSAEEKTEHLFFHWKKKPTNADTTTYLGYGQTITRPSTEFLNYQKFGVQVMPDVLLRGAYEKVTMTSGGEAVTLNGEQVFVRL